MTGWIIRNRQGIWKEGLELCNDTKSPHARANNHLLRRRCPRGVMLLCECSASAGLLKTVSGIAALCFLYNISCMCVNSSSHQNPRHTLLLHALIITRLLVGLASGSSNPSFFIRVKRIETYHRAYSECNALVGQNPLQSSPIAYTCAF